jgi:hypothetical protein
VTDVVVIQERHGVVAELERSLLVLQQVLNGVAVIVVALREHLSEHLVVWKHL